MTQLFGSPALMRVLADHGEPLHGVQRVTSAGAPVPAEVVAKMRALLPDDAQFWTPYGATECLPVAVIEGRELQGTRAQTESGAGTCVGRPVAPNEVRIIAIDDAPICNWTDDVGSRTGRRWRDHRGRPYRHRQLFQSRRGYTRGEDPRGD